MPEVENLAIADQYLIPVLTRQRLISPGDIDDRQPPEAKPYLLLMESLAIRTLIIGPAVA